MVADSEKTPAKPLLFLFLIVSFGLIPRIIDIINSSGIELDGVFYANMAEHFAKGEFKEALGGVFPPFYPFLIGIFHHFIYDLEFAGRFTSLIIGILLILLCYYVIKRTFGQKKALYMSFFIAIHPYLVRFSAQVLSESTAIFIFTLGIFLFYWGWTEEKIYFIAISGICLGLTYLTRPEYIVYPAPLSLILLFKRRFKDFIVFSLCFFVVAFPYVLYLKSETGLWVISKKAILAKQQETRELSMHSYLFPVLSFLNTFKNIPSVIYHFFEALFPPFIILLFCGIKGSEKKFMVLTGLLFLFHIISISLITSSTRRFSVEFIPILLVFAVTGICNIEDYLSRFRKKIFFFSALFIIVASSLFQGIIYQDSGRIMNKKAGLFMKTYDPGAKIASRIPLVPFYSRGEWINIVEEIKVVKDCKALIDALKSRGTKYIVVDEVLHRISKGKNIDLSGKGCIMDMNCIANFENRDEFLRILKIADGR